MSKNSTETIGESSKEKFHCQLSTKLTDPSMTYISVLSMSSQVKESMLFVEGIKKWKLPHTYSFREMNLVLQLI